MGVVYKGKAATTSADVAIKVMRPGGSIDSGVLARFRGEARAAGQVQHPNAVKVFDYGALEGGSQFIVMELVQGTSLQQYLSKRQCLPWVEALDITRKLASFMDAVHDSAIIHRDLKPANVMLCPTRHEGLQVRVLDFGVVKWDIEAYDGTTTVADTAGAPIGTPAYMAPEQFTEPASCDRRVDIYALGTMLREMLTGRQFFAARSIQGCLYRHVMAAVPPPSADIPEAGIPAALDGLVLAMLAKSPADRPATMADVVHGLDELPKAAGLPGADEAPSPGVAFLTTLAPSAESLRVKGGQAARTTGSVNVQGSALLPTALSRLADSDPRTGDDGGATPDPAPAPGAVPLLADWRSLASRRWLLVTAAAAVLVVGVLAATLLHWGRSRQQDRGTNELSGPAPVTPPPAADAGPDRSAGAAADSGSPDDGASREPVIDDQPRPKRRRPPRRRGSSRPKDRRPAPEDPGGSSARTLPVPAPAPPSPGPPARTTEDELEDLADEFGGARR